MDGFFRGHLKEGRVGSATNKESSRREKRLDLAPGKGIIARDFPQNGNAQDSTSSIDQTSSDESTLSETSDESDGQEISRDTHRQKVCLGDFAIIKFPTKKTIKYYV